MPKRQRKKRMPFPDPSNGPVFYLLEDCHGNVEVCSGCGWSLRDCEGNIPEVPQDLILVLKGRRAVPHEEFYSRPVNMYFHAKFKCLQISPARLGFVNPRNFRCPEALTEHLEENHIQVMKELRSKPKFANWGET